MKRFVAYCVAFFAAALLLFLAVDAFRSRSAVKKAVAIKVGDSKQQVRRVLGRPSSIGVAGIFDHTETWAYGGFVDWQRITSSPLPSAFSDQILMRFPSNSIRRGR